MRESGYYPPGAEFDPSAPYNEPVVPEREFEITISQTLSKLVTVTTDKYIPEVDYETGDLYTNTSETDWYGIYEEEQYNILELLDHLQTFAEKELKNVSPNSGRGRELQRIIESCKDWTVDDYCIEE